MAYTWNRNGGVRLSGKLTQGGTDPFKLMSAGDLAWDGVQMKDGTAINDSDDLLNYIDNVKDVLGERIDNVSSSNAGYEVRCEKSVCYVGEVLNNIPFYIYKNGTLLTWANITTEGITLKSPITKPTGANCLIQFTSNG